jgi:hypothetical protein
MINFGWGGVMMVDAYADRDGNAGEVTEEVGTNDRSFDEVHWKCGDLLRIVSHLSKHNVNALAS